MSRNLSSEDAGLAPRDSPPKFPKFVNTDTIEERCFAAALICLDGHWSGAPRMGPKTTVLVVKFVSRTLEKTHALRDVREALSRNVAIWMWMTRVFNAAIRSLTTRSVGPLACLNDPDKGVTPQESTALIIKNYQSLKDDLQMLNKLMHIARNLLVTTEPEVPQDLGAAVHFDQMVYQTIILCVNVTSKAYDGEILDDASRSKLTEIGELYKKVLVTSLQQAHNWTAKNDRNKMSFWFDVLFDEDAALDDPTEGLGDGPGFRVDVAKTEVQHWLERNSRMCDSARKLLREYAGCRAQIAPGPLVAISPLAWNWLPQESGSSKVRDEDPRDTEKMKSQWNPNETDKFEQDRAYGRVSREVDMWWIRARDPNFEDWVVPVPSVEFAQQRTATCKTNLVHRYAHQFRPEDQDGADQADDDSQPGLVPDGDSHAAQEYAHEYVDDMVEDEDVDDDESYGDGPMTGLLTEVPNILDPKQIEALHMIIKSCILDAAGSGWTRVGENLQKTRCRMFLALDCGKSLLREMLVFIAVWEKDEQSLVFQITSQIVEAIHHSALVPYAWNSLRIPKDIISPAQTVLLRLINYMFRARIKNPPPEEAKDHRPGTRLVHFFFSSFRSRIVPECVALMHLQAQIRENVMDPTDFPVDNWDMERAKDGLTQFLDFLITVSEDVEMRSKLIEWELAYDLITLLKALEAGVSKKPHAELPNRSQHRAADSSLSGDRHQDGGDHPPPPPPPPPMQEPAHKFPWSGVKGQLLQVLAALLQPAPGQTTPGNPTVQSQVVRHDGIISLISCCAYDDHNRYARERVQLCLKWLMDGSEAANKFMRDLVTMSPSSDTRPSTPAPGGGPAMGATTNLRGGEVEAAFRPPGVPAATGHSGNSTSTTAGPSSAVANALNSLLPPQGQMVPRGRTDELLRDIISLADEAARLALRENGDDTEDEEFM